MKMVPLATRMRPKEISKLRGQKHLLGPYGQITNMLMSKQLHSMILFGPPGTGKTSLANVLSLALGIPFHSLNGVLHGKKEIMDILKLSQNSDQTHCMYIDEIHRMSRTQLEPLLPAIEKGDIVLIGSTTESVYHALPSGILSRCRLFELHPLSSKDIKEALIEAIEDERDGLGSYDVSLKDEVLNFMAETCGGDLRGALTLLEASVMSAVQDGGVSEVSLAYVENMVGKKAAGFNGNDTVYDLLSAFQKSIRGSDVDAAVYYLARLIEIGDLPLICRRLSIIAFEDVSLQSPSSWVATMAAVECAERVGLPEARIPLVNAVVLLSMLPKSNASYKAIDLALSTVGTLPNTSIPKHLRDSHYQGAATRGNGTTYLYPHDYDGGWIKQDYLPELLIGTSFYKPPLTGKERQLFDYHSRFTT